MRRLLLPLAAALAAAFVAPAAAAPPPEALDRRDEVVTWSGTLTAPDAGCDRAELPTCDRTRLVVDAPRGSWVTVDLAAPGPHLRVTLDGHAVGDAGHTASLRSGTDYTTEPPTTTFQQVRSGRVAYEVAVGSPTASPALPEPYTARARLLGQAFDRSGDCFVGDSGLAALQAPDDGRRLRLAVRLVSEPADAREVREVLAPALVEAYDRIGIDVVPSFDAFALEWDAFPWEAAVARYGTRPAGVDVVHVLTDRFAGGHARCLGGIAYPELAFSAGSLHYAPAGEPARVPTVSGGTIAAHEVGHLLGGQHQMTSCAEALPAQAQRPARDGTAGACTVMNPSALLVSPTFSVLERAVLRQSVRRFAGR